MSIGDTVIAAPAGLSTVVVGIDTPAGPTESAAAGDSVTIRLRDELDLGRGQVLSRADQPEQLVVTEQILGVACWLDERAGTANQRVLLKVGTSVVRGILTGVSAHWQVDEQRWQTSAQAAALNDIVRLSIRVAEPVAVDEYADVRHTGGFLVIDPASGITLAAGMIGDPLTRAVEAMS